MCNQIFCLKLSNFDWHSVPMQPMIKCPARIIRRKQNCTGNAAYCTLNITTRKTIWNVSSCCVHMTITSWLCHCSVRLVIFTNPLCSNSKTFVDSIWFDSNVWCVSNILLINSFNAYSTRIGWMLHAGNAHRLTTCVQVSRTYGSWISHLHYVLYKDAQNTVWHWSEATCAF